ncbi:hypothetical protein Aperf_G00000115310 [Anoplocephala perfoliata]
MGVLVSKPVKPQTKARARSHSGSSQTKKPQLFKSLSRKKDEAPRKPATTQPTKTGASQPSPSREVRATNEQMVQQSAILAEEAIAKATTTIEEAEINDMASKITDEVLQASIEQTQKGEDAGLKDNKPTETAAEVPPEQITDLTGNTQQQLETEAVTEPNEASKEGEKTEVASPSDFQKPAEEALNDKTATDGDVKGDNAVNPEVQESEPRVTLLEGETEAVAKPSEASEEIKNTEEAFPSDGQKPEGEALNDNPALDSAIQGDNQEGENKATPPESVKQPEVVIAEE